MPSDCTVISISFFYKEYLTLFRNHWSKYRTSILYILPVKRFLIKPNANICPKVDLCHKQIIRWLLFVNIFNVWTCFFKPWMSSLTKEKNGLFFWKVQAEVLCILRWAWRTRRAHFTCSVREASSETKGETEQRRNPQKPSLSHRKHEGKHTSLSSHHVICFCVLSGSWSLVLKPGGLRMAVMHQVHSVSSRDAANASDQPDRWSITTLHP